MRVLHLLACATLLGLANAQNASNGTNSTITYKGPEAAHYREYYYIGGQFISDGMGGQTVTHQMYVEELTPADGVTQQYPLIFVHGEPFCGAVWLNTPDGREGWASYFLKLGYKVILVDSPGSARSSKLKYEGSLDPYSVSTVESYFTLNRHPNYWSQSINHTQFPGNGSFGDPTFDIVYKSYLQIPDPTLLNVTASAVADAGAALLEKVGTSIIIGAGLENFALVIAEATPDKVKAVVQVEPEGPPFEQWTSNGTNITGKAHIYGITEKPLTFSPPVNSPQDLVYERVGVNSTDFRPCMLQKAPAKQLVNLARVPVLVVAGAASIAVPYIHCTVSFLQQAGVNVTYYRLDQLGIYGNGHFLFVELNNLVIADKLQGWLSQFTVGSG